MPPERARCARLSPKSGALRAVFPGPACRSVPGHRGRIGGEAFAGRSVRARVSPRLCRPVPPSLCRPARVAPRKNLNTAPCPGSGVSLAGRRNASCQAQQSARAVPETLSESISAQNSPKRGPRGVLFTSKPSVGSPNAGKSAQNFCGTSVTLLRTKRNPPRSPEGRRGVSKGDVYRCARPCAPGPGTGQGGPLQGPRGPRPAPRAPRARARARYLKKR